MTTMSNQEPVFLFDGDDRAMLEAGRRARESFKYFWREIYWENHRIVPALDGYAVKVAFTDGVEIEGQPSVEHMWVEEVFYDGEILGGKLLNDPKWLKSVRRGDAIVATMDRVSDWMFVRGGVVHGAFTVNLMRSRMNDRDRRAHDNAWGLDFGDPNHIEMFYTEAEAKKGIGGLFSKPKTQVNVVHVQIEHPMCLNMGGKLREFLRDHPEAVHVRDDMGYTLLHNDALAGNLLSVQILLEHGVDPNLRTNYGKTALDLARLMGWDHIIPTLEKVTSQ